MVSHTPQSRSGGPARRVVEDARDAAPRDPSLRPARDGRAPEAPSAGTPPDPRPAGDGPSPEDPSAGRAPDPPTSPAGSLDVLRPFTREQALAAGISRRRLTGPGFRRLFRNVYVHVRASTRPLVRLDGALLVHPADAFASHLSAARVYRLPVPATPEEHVTVCDKADRRRRPGLVNHLAPPGALVRVVDGRRVSDPLPTFVELAEVLTLVDLVVVGDAMVRRDMFSPDELRAHCAASRDRHAQQARAAAAYVRERVDSPMETRLRMLIVLAGLPEPAVDFRIHYPDGRLRFRFDLCYPGLGLVVEYDGQQHREDLDQWDHDIERREWMDQHHWRLLVVVARGIFQRPEATLARVHTALREHGCESLPRALRDDWRPYFPTKP